MPHYPFLSMSIRPMQTLPLPSDSEKYIRALIRMDTATIGTFNAIRLLHAAVKTRCPLDEISEETMSALLRASWAVENSQERARQIVAKRDKKSYDAYVRMLNGLTATVKSLAYRCSPYQKLPFNLTSEALLCAGDICVNMRTYLQ